MSTPVLLAIVLNMQTALQGISTAAGYFNTVKLTSVVLDPIALTMESPTELPFVVIGHLIEPVDQVFTSRGGIGGRSAMLLTDRIILEAALDAPGTSTARKLTAIAQFAADVEVALVKDVSRGGWAMDTRVKQFTSFVGLPAQSRCFVQVPIEIKYGRQYGQP